ncbi:MAG: sugar O-acetyltransferase [Pirellulaceae bacterium]
MLGDLSGNRPAKSYDRVIWFGLRADVFCSEHDRFDKRGLMRTKSEKTKMLAGELYRSADPELVEDTKHAQRLVAQYNATSAEATETRMTLLRRLCGSVGDGAVVRPPFACDYGYNIRLGQNAFINFNCVFLDCALIEIGDNLQMGPAVQLYTAAHPLEADIRRSGLEYARPIRIGHDVWIGGGAIILPGVTIGDGSVIGAGSVVTRDISSAKVVAGNPARILRALGGHKDMEV